MATRLELGTKLKTFCDNVYFQPPNSKVLTYPCIVYSRADFSVRDADNKKYFIRDKYQLMVIYKDSDNEVPKNLLTGFDYIIHDRTYISDNLYHDTFDLYW